MKRYRVAVIPGDGVGQEVVPAAVQVLNRVAELSGTFTLDYEEFPWGSGYYLETGRMMDEDGLTRLQRFDAIFLGAVGYPSVPDHITLWGLLLPIRQRFNLYANLRPVRLLPGIVGPLRDKRPEDIDMLVVRENSEGEYSGVGGRVHVGYGHEVAIQTDVFTREGVDKVVRYAFSLARDRRKRLASITKSNASPHAFVFWDEVVQDLMNDFPDVTVDRILVDAAAAYFITQPEMFDVVVASNLFGDVLTDIGAVIQGSMGVAASANINPDGGYPGMFEPVHGSAPNIAGQGIANPLGSIWAGALMLEQLGEPESGLRLLAAMERVLAETPIRTRDLGGDASTAEMARAVAEHLG